MRERKLNRKKDHDYSRDGCYCITTVTKNREHWFGKIENGQMILNEYGRILNECWVDLPNHYKNCILDEMIIMPNHIHGIIKIDNSNIFTVGTGRKSVGTGLKPVPTENKKPVPAETNKPTLTQNKRHGLSEFMRALKTFSSRRINGISNNQFKWQRSFYDRIIRNEEEYINFKNYIINNPMNWNEDQNNQS